MTLRGYDSISQKQKLVKSEHYETESVSHRSVVMKRKMSGIRRIQTDPLPEGVSS